MKLAPQLQDYTDRCKAFVEEHGHKLEDIRYAGDAWTVAHRTGIWREAYEHDATDKHVETVLRRIFPNAFGH